MSIMRIYILHELESVATERFNRQPTRLVAAEKEH